MAAAGLYVELEPWSYCFFQYSRASKGLRRARASTGDM